MIYLTTGATAHSTGFLFGGTATFTDVLYSGIGAQTAFDAAATPTYNTTKTPGTVMVLTAADAGTDTEMRVWGQFRVNAAGTIIPQIKFSVNPTGTNLAKAGTYFRCWPAGSKANAAVGLWA